LRGQKGQLYEGGMRTPAVVSWQGTLAPRKVEDLMHMVDWMPTLTRLAGCDQSDSRWDGVDIWPLLTGDGGAEARRCIYWNLRHQRFALVHENWKLILDQRGDEPVAELFDIIADPYEKTDLAQENPEVVKTLSKMIANEREQDNTSKRADVNE